jgi:hypothetical protein
MSNLSKLPMTYTPTKTLTLNGNHYGVEVCGINENERRNLKDGRIKY